MTTGSMLPSEPLWTVREVAEFLRLSTKTVYRLSAEGRLPCVKLGGSLRFMPNRIRAWASGELATTTQARTIVRFKLPEPT
jgi:excisionase family DNA binding protein